MANNAAKTARAAQADSFNAPGMCLQQSRQWAGIPARYPDAATAWRNANDKHRDKNPPRGAAVYWTGGSRGFGHIAISMGKKRVRSTDANGWGRVATRPIGWFSRHWPSLKYAGWSWDINEVTIPHRKPPAKKAAARKTAGSK
jgi:hypothetical protein